MSIYRNITCDNITHKIFIFLKHGHDTRGNAMNLVFPPVRTTLFRNSIVCAGPQVWNQLPNNIKYISTSCTCNIFKQTIKGYLIGLQEL